MFRSVFAIMLSLAIVGCSGLSDRPRESRREPQLAAGDRHSLYLDPYGVLWAWGDNENGQLGDGTTDRSYVPEKIPGDFSSVTAGAIFSLALKADGSLWGWGSTFSGVLIDSGARMIRMPRQIGMGYQAVSAACFHVVALRTDGTLWAWGQNEHGVLGNGQTTGSSAPVEIGTGFSAISAGCFYNLALKPDGSLWSWGWNEGGVLGDGTAKDAPTPEQVGDGYSAIFAGDIPFATKRDGSVWSWGNAYAGSESEGSRPSKVGNGVRSIASAAAGFADVSTRGSLLRSLQPGELKGNFRVVAGRNDHFLAADGEGNVWAWGNNYWGVLGDDFAEPKTDAPQRVRFDLRENACPAGPFPPDAKDANADGSRAGPLLEDSIPFSLKVPEIQRINTGVILESGGGLLPPGEGRSSISAFDFDRHEFILVEIVKYGDRGRIPSPSQPLSPAAERVIRQTGDIDEVVTAMSASPDEFHRMSCLADKMLAIPDHREANAYFTDGYYQSTCLMKGTKCLNTPGGARADYLRGRIAELVRAASEPLIPLAP